MLGHIGESPVNSISNTNALPVSAATAISALDEISRSVQSEGWQFNTEVNVTLSTCWGWLHNFIRGHP